MDLYILEDNGFTVVLVYFQISSQQSPVEGGFPIL